MKKRKCKRFMTGALAVLLAVTMNINPVATIAGAIADSGLVDRFANLKNNLSYIADVNSNVVFADEGGETSPGCDCEVTVNCDHRDTIKKLMEATQDNLSDGTTLKDINDSISGLGTSLTAISGYVDGLEDGQQDILNALGYSSEDGTYTLAGDLATIKTSLTNIENALAGIQATMRDQQHAYFVAHLYSLNNQFSNALYRPYSKDVPYVADFATVWGKFANVYTGYWDTAVTDLNSSLWWRKTHNSSDPNEFIYNYDRYAEVLGDDIIVIKEGVVEQNVVLKNNEAGNYIGLAGANYFAGDMNSLSPNTFLTLSQEVINENSVTWLDAVTVLYKAMGQEYFTYQAYMAHDPSITPEHSPAFQNLSNPCPNLDNKPHPYNGYNVYFFTTRANPINPKLDKDGKATVNNIYWTKALKDGIIPSSVDRNTGMDKPIMASDFWMLAEDIMSIYGEEFINDDEVKALLQVYGSEYPVQLGYKVADAWAYLKVRGCLECPMSASDSVTRDQLLDVATRIKDKSFRGNYKVINVTLDLSDIMRDSGYYPVYDLNTTTDSFSTETVYNYEEMSYYSYVLPYMENNNLGTVGDFRVYKAGEKTDANAIDSNLYAVSVINLDGKQYLRLDMNKSYTGNIFIGKTVYGDSSMKTNGTVDFICIPSNALGGGVFSAYNVINNTATFKWETDNDVASFMKYNKTEELLSCNDYMRAGAKRPTPSEVAYNSTIADTLLARLDYWTSPMTVSAAEPTTKKTPVTVSIYAKEVKASNTTRIDMSLSKSLAFTIPNKINALVLPGGNAGRLFEGLPDDAELYAAPEGSILESIYHARLILKSPKLNEYTKGMAGIGGFNNVSTFIKGYGTNKDISTDALNGYCMSGNNAVFGTVGIEMSRNLCNDLVHKNNGSTQYYGKISASGHPEPITQDYSLAQMLVYWKSNLYLNGSYTMLKDPDESAGYWQGSPDRTFVYKEGTFAGGKAIKVNFASTYAESMGAWADYLNTDFSKEDINAAREWIDVLEVSDIYRYKESINFKTTKPDNVLDKFGSSDEGLKKLVSGGQNPDGGEATNEETRLDLPTTVASDAIMKKDQQILLKWSDLVKAKYVISEDTGKLPTLQKDGSLYFYTNNGQVKVNNSKHTIQIGTMLYDLSHTADDSMQLYYFDNEQGLNGELYIDYRCVLGVVRDKIKYDDTDHCTKLEGNSIGSGEAVVYDLGSSKRSNAYDVVSVLTYNYPEIPCDSVGTDILDNVTGYPIDIIKKTRYDGGETGNGTAVYWDDDAASKSVRMSMASFVPTANWITVIRQTSYAEEDTDAYLFIWYPKEPFKNGYTEDGTTILYPTENAQEKAEYYADYVTRVNDASASKNSNLSLKNALTAAYGDWENTTDWYIQMSCASLAKLYELTGSYYISSDYVLRQVCLTNTSAYSAVNTFTGEQKENECIANRPGTAYWVQSIGFVYNMPSASAFTLTDYFNGKYLLPLAVDIANKYTTTPNVINYNLSYYGYYPVLKDGVWSYDNKVVYGNALTSNGIMNSIGGQTVVTIDNLPTENNCTPEKLIPPILVEGSGEPGSDNHDHCYQPAPSGVYIYFGSSPLEQQTVKGISQYASYRNSVFYGTNQIKIESSDSLSTDVTIRMFGNQYCKFNINSANVAYRTLHTAAKDVLVIEPGNIQKSNLNGVTQIETEDTPTNEILDWLEGLGSNDLLSAIDNSSTWLIIIAFKVLPWIGIILMTILVGLAFLADTKIFRVICEKTIDPVRILTFGGRDIDHWHWKKVLIPCMILFISFALFLNGNIIRVIMWGAKWWGVVIQWFKNI